MWFVSFEVAERIEELKERIRELRAGARGAADTRATPGQAVENGEWEGARELAEVVWREAK